MIRLPPALNHVMAEAANPAMQLAAAAIKPIAVAALTTSRDSSLLEEGELWLGNGRIAVRSKLASALRLVVGRTLHEWATVKQRASTGGRI